MRNTIALVFSALMFVNGCSVTGDPIEMSKVCDLANDGKNFQVSGVLTPRSSIYCSNRGGRMECPFDFLESPGSQTKITTDIEVGSGANTMDEVPKGFKKDDLKVRDNAGNAISIGTDIVKATGKMMIAPAAPGGQGVCLMQVYKIER
jgi:hypothetical protein